MDRRGKKKLLVVSAAGLSEDPDLAGIEFRQAESVLPALTCPVQASFRTAATPARHGMIANGLFFRRLGKVMFWEQSSALVAGGRIWDGFRARGGRVGMMFWQQSLGERVDLLLSPAPIHKHHGGLIMDCYARPGDLYAWLCQLLGGCFKLHRYWGPLASAKVGDWIAAAAATVLDEPHLAPDLLLLYLPTCDYDFQRHGPRHPKGRRALDALRAQLAGLCRTAARRGFEVLLFGDYAVADTAAPPGASSASTPAVFPNRALRDAGLLQTRSLAGSGRAYPDYYDYRAFAMVDHEIAHVYVRSPDDLPQTRRVLAGLDGVDEVMDADARRAAGVDHPRSGELLCLAEPGRWFAYPWWSQPDEAPDYARHVDIHNKPGFDPCELFFGWPPTGISRDTSRIRGTHGRAGPGRRIAWGATFDLPGDVGNLIDLAAAVKAWLDEEP